MRPTPAPTRKSNVLAPLTKLVGRAAELSALEALAQEHRLLTLVGPPGSGKSRLALEHARARLAELGQPECGGVWVCDFADAREQDDASAVLARMLDVDVGGETGDAIVTRLGRALAARGPMLLVLDNFERGARAADPAVGALLEIASELQLLVTSRVRLGIPGEATFDVRPLPLPPPGASSDACLASDAVALLVQRARAARSDFAPRDAEIAAIAELARRLDGLPLALELAAARVALVGAATLLERLTTGLDLATGPRDRPRAALKDALDWSWSMLEPHERSALAQLSVFRGGFTLAAAESVLSLRGTTATVLETLAGLCDHSLLGRSQRVEPAGESRFTILETVRSYAAQRLAEGNEAEAAEARHGAYFLTVGERWATEVDQRDGPRALARLSAELENLVAVHERALRSDLRRRVERALRAVLALEPVFYMRGPTARCLALLTEALEGGIEDVAPGVAAKARKAYGRALRDAGRLREARRELDEGRSLAKALEDRSLEGRVLGHLAFLAELEGRAAEALANVEEALACVREAGDQRSEGMLLAIRARLRTESGDHGEAMSDYDEAVRLHRVVGNRYAEAYAVTSRAELHRLRGRRDASRVDLLAGLTMYREFGERRHEASALAQLARLDQDEGRVPEAREALERAIAWFREDGSARVGLALGQLADLEREEGHLDVARGLYLEAVAAARDAADKTLEDRWLLAAGACSGATPRHSPARRAAGLLVADSGRWFRVGDAEPVSLQRRHALRLILHALAERRVNQPDRALTQAELLEAGWPGEKVRVHAGMLRVYNALSTLRKLGLRDVLLSRDDGYLLDPLRETVISAEPG